MSNYVKQIIHIRIHTFMGEKMCIILWIMWISTEKQQKY